MVYYVVGIDGGGTKTELVATGLDGQEWFRLQGGPVNINGTSAEKARNALAGLISAAGIKAGNASMSAICIGAAGVSNPKAEEMLLSALSQAGCNVPVMITGDHQAALAGALGKPTGMLLIAGTGSICCGRNENGEEARTGGRGHLIDDEGSGYAIGRDILSAVVRSDDGRIPPTILTRLVFEKLGISSVRQLVAEIYKPGQGKEIIAGFSELLPEALKRQDAQAAEIVRKAGDALCALVIPVAGKLGLQKGTLALSGSVLIKDEAVRRAVQEKLALALPGLETVLPLADAASGAALLARNLLSEQHTKTL